jgi:hypothetical protein
MSRDNAHTVELPTQAIDHLPQQAVDHLPANVPTAPEIHHEESPGGVIVNPVIFFDASTYRLSIEIALCTINANA